MASNGHDLHDPHLTGKGRAQCRARQKAFARHKNVELMLALTLTRAL